MEITEKEYWLQREQHAVFCQTEDEINKEIFNRPGWQIDHITSNLKPGGYCCIFGKPMAQQAPKVENVAWCNVKRKIIKGYRKLVFNVLEVGATMVLVDVSDGESEPIPMPIEHLYANSTLQVGNYVLCEFNLATNKWKIVRKLDCDGE